MCGIAGIWNFDQRPIHRSALDSFTDSVAHRGPDGRGIWINENHEIALGHRRLAILDLSEEGRQPMSYDNSRYWITYNGEIYNFLELRSELEQKGHRFRSQSDTEVILGAYQEWGPDMLVRFNGMWSFAIYDTKERTLFIARDRFGIKPFLYHLTSSRFAFSSELKAFKYLEGFEPSIDTESAITFLRNGFGTEGTDRTMLEGVRRLPGGHYGIVRNGTLSVVRWWNTLDHLVEVPASLQAQAERFRELFYDSIRLRMRSDVPIGTCLSGGFDSTAVVCALSDIGRHQSDFRQAKDWQHAFVATFPGAMNDESIQAQEAIRFAGIKATLMPVTENDALLNIDRILADFDDVYIGLPTPAWLIYRELRKAGVVVSLDGHGADELMGGYIPMAENGGLFENMLTSAKLILHYHPFLSLFRRIVGTVRRHRGIEFLKRNTPSVRNELSFPCANDRLPADWGAVNHMLYPMFHSTVLPTILRNFDRMSMAHGVEVRMPFMDWRLVTYVFSLPDASKVGGGFTKRVARLGMAGKMPDSIRLSKRKIGFGSPLPAWFNGPLESWIRGLLDRGREHDLIDMPRFQKFVEENMDKHSWTWQNAEIAWRHLHYLWFEQEYVKR